MPDSLNASITLSLFANFLGFSSLVVSFISFLIEKYYRDLCVKDNSKLNSYLLNYSKILKQISNMQKLNLSEKNTFIWIKEVLYNETR